MPKIRIYYENQIKKDVEIIPTKKQLHYLRNVMRKKANDLIYLFNQTDGEWKTKIVEQDVLKLIPKHSLPKKDILDLNDVWILVGLTKPKTLKYIAEKVSEIGISKMIPLKTEYSYNTKVNLAKYKKIMIEAVEQSEGIKIPNIEDAQTVKEVLFNWDEKRLIVFCDEKECKEKIFKVLLNNCKSKMGIFFGPVGGWSNAERSFFRTKSNFLSVSLGGKLLKVDTAVIYALACYAEALGYKNEE